MSKKRYKITIERKQNGVTLEPKIVITDPIERLDPYTKVGDVAKLLTSPPIYETIIEIVELPE
jgi:hypothetical protein